MRTLLAASTALLLAACSVAQGQTTQGQAQPAAAPAGPPPGMPAPLTPADRPNATGGEKLYVLHCAMCHGPNGMGQGLLGRKGIEPDLEKRTNLTKNYVVLAARRGIGNMPQVPRGEVSDADLAAIAEYLASGKGPAQ